MAIPRGIYKGPYGQHMRSKYALWNKDSFKMSNTGEAPEVPILDIRHGRNQSGLREELLFHLRPAVGQQKRLPIQLLYDETGLKLYEEITHQEEYYLERQEREILYEQADKIAQRIGSGTQLVELGSGWV